MATASGVELGKHASSQGRPSLSEGRAATRIRANRSALLILPALLLILAVFAYPVGVILLRAFTSHSGTEDGIWANFDWYLTNSVQRTILLRTFITSASVTAICLVVCYPFTYVLTTLKGAWFALALGIVLISSGQSILVRTFAWKILLRDNGPINMTLDAAGLGRVHLLGTTGGVIVAMCQVMAPFMILSLYSSMRGIDGRLIDASRSLGASAATSFIRVYAPLSLPGVAAGSLLVFVLSLGFYVTPAVVGSPQNSLLSQAIVNEIRTKLDWGHAGAMALTLLVLTLLLIAVVTVLTSRKLAVVSGRGQGR